MKIKHQKYEKRNSWKWYENSSIVNEIETLNDEDRTIEELKKVFPDELEKLEETLNNYISENDLTVSW